MSNRKPDYRGLEEARNAIRSTELSTQPLEPESVKIICNRYYQPKRKCILVPYERKDGRIGWVGTACKKHCKFP